MIRCFCWGVPADRSSQRVALDISGILEALLVALMDKNPDDNSDRGPGRGLSSNEFLGMVAELERGTRLIWQSMVQTAVENPRFNQALKDICSELGSKSGDGNAANQ